MSIISVIGAGTMGNGIAQTFAMHGYKVFMVDSEAGQLEKGMLAIRSSLDRLEKKSAITAGQKESTLANIDGQVGYELSVHKSDLIIEAIPEVLEWKTELFKKLDLLAPEHAILASNTSSISITKLGKVTRRPHKFIGMLFMNPVPIMKLVEVINGYDTSPETTATIVALCESINKVPVEVKDYPGFVSNRILMPMINEAIYVLYESIADAEAIDTVMKLGMAHPMGPLRLADLIGLDTCLAILDVLYHGFKQPKYAPCPLLVNMVNAGKLGVKSGEGFYKY